MKSAAVSFLASGMAGRLLIRISILNIFASGTNGLKHAAGVANNTVHKGCKCDASSSNAQHRPSQALLSDTSEGQELPACFEQHAVDHNTFLEPKEFAASQANCFPDDYFGSWSEARILSCLAPDGVIGTKQAPTFYLLGDSHSVSLRSSVKRATSMQVFSAAWWGGQVSHITAALRKVLQPGDVVGYSVRWDMSSVQQFAGNVEALAMVAAEKGARTMVFEDNPTLNGHASICYMSAAAKGAKPTSCRISWAEVHGLHAPYAAAIQNIQQRFSSVEYFDWMPNLLCDEATGYCDINVPGTLTPAYRDGDHLSSDGAAFLAPFICDYMADHHMHGGGFH